MNYLDFFSYPRAIFLPVFVIVITIICSTLAVVLSLFKAPRYWVDFVICDIWAMGIVKAAGIEIKTSLPKNLPQSGFLYLFSHSSYFDIPILMASSPKSFRFGAKEELFMIPFFAHAMRAVGVLKITRDNREKVIDVYKEAEKRVKNGESFALSPEGGRRTSDIKGLKAFKSGPFIFAINAKMPLVPVVLKGVDDIMAKKSWFINLGKWKRKVELIILPYVDTSLVKPEDYKLIRDKIYTQMSEVYNS